MQITIKMVSNDRSIFAVVFVLLTVVAGKHQHAVADQSTSPENLPKIAVIGAGIGGASTSHFLRKLFGPSCKIVVYEARQVGGRLAVANIGGRLYETGGHVIHARNNYMVQFAKLLGLSKRTTPSSRLGLYDGKEYLFTEDDIEIMNYIKLFWRYGGSILRLPRFISDILDNFSRIYSLQDKGCAFNTVSDMLSALSPSFVNMTQMNAETHLKQHEFSNRFINEMVMAITRVNYGQTPASMNAFVGAVALAGAEPGLWSVAGGNYQVPELLLKGADVTVTMSKVTKVTLLNEKQFLVQSQLAAPGLESGQLANDTYDVVIVATPLAPGMSGIQFEGFPAEFPTTFDNKYHRTVATHVEGSLNVTLLQTNEEIDMVLTTNTDVMFNSLSINYPADGPVDGSGAKKSDVWKLFSQEPLSETQLNSLFISRIRTHVTDWLAYPHYQPPERLGEFALYPNLYYTSCIEWAASAMEMSAIAGRNAALLAYNAWTGMLTSRDCKLATAEGDKKIEL